MSAMLRKLNSPRGIVTRLGERPLIRPSTFRLVCRSWMWERGADISRVLRPYGPPLVGLDFSNRMLAEATKRAEQLRVACEFVFGDAESLPFDAARFDVVSSRHLLFNLPRPGLALREWFSVLNPVAV